MSQFNGSSDKNVVSKQTNKVEETAHVAPEDCTATGNLLRRADKHAFKLLSKSLAQLLHDPTDYPSTVCLTKPHMIISYLTALRKVHII